MTALKKNHRAFSLVFVVAVFIFGYLVSLSLSQEREDYPFPEDPLKGSKLFVSKGCIKCHAIWGIGDTFGPDLVQMSKDKSLLQLAGLLWSHSPKMIEIMKERGVMRPTFSPQEMGDLMGYIYFFNYFDQPGNFTEGEILFTEKGCSRCHSLGPENGRDKIPMDEYGKYISPSFLVTGMWNHGPDILEEMRRMGISQPEFKGQELSHLLAYIRGEAVVDGGLVQYAEPGSPKRGKDLFHQQKCDLCHTVWGEGRKQASDLGKRDLRLTLTEIAGMIWSHSGQMWRDMRRAGIPFPDFSSKQMADIISYLYFIQFFDENGDPKKGKGLYREKTCIFCHSLEGEGEDVGPSLAESEAHFSPIFLASSMWNHALVMEDMLEEKDLSWPRFSGNEMRDLVSYIQTATQSAKEEKKAIGIVPPESKVLFLSVDRFNLEVAKEGKSVYLAKACQACHSVDGTSGAMGGDLKDITKIRDLEWLFNFIKNPRDMLRTDGLAKQLLREYNNIPMPQQGLTDEQVLAVIEYLKAPEKVK